MFQSLQTKLTRATADVEAFIAVAATHSICTDLKNKRLTSFVVFPVDGSKDNALFDSGADTQFEDGLLGETYYNLDTIFAHTDSYDEEFFGA